MTTRTPLGKREDQHLEFKSAAALARPETVSRDTVALLNGQGGEIWIGVEERDEFAVAVQPIPDVTASMRALHDHLIDSIEPSPTSNEVSLEKVPAPGGGDVIRVSVQPAGNRGPCAVQRGGGRYFLLRVGARSRPMTREELRELFRSAVGGDAAVRETRKVLLAQRQEAKAGLWVLIQPVEELELDLDDKEYVRFLMDPEATGNRPTGWVFTNPYQQPSMRRGSIVQATGRWEGPSMGMKRAEIRRDGSVALQVAKRELAWKDESVHPFALVEYPTSLFRLAACVYKHAGFSAGLVLADLALLGAADLALRPGSPLQTRFAFGEQRHPADEADEILMAPREFQAGGIVEEPDRCAARLWREIYHGFGYGQEELPPEYDSDTGRLVIRT